MNEMPERPELDRKITVDDFLGHYYLKEELVRFCRDNGLPVSGGKTELTERIAHFLSGGEIMTPRPKNARQKSVVGEITRETVIEENIVCSEKHRAFFLKEAGKGFRFCVRENAGKTYGEAVDAYFTITSDKTKKPIGKQFEYNTYIQDFFADNKGKTLDDAILCWNYKKSLKGHNRYERSDLTALDTDKSR